MTDAQTEARALLETAGARFPDYEEYDAAVAVIATALAAKDAELERRDMQLEASAKVALDLSAQLAEARKALEPDAYEVRCTDGNYEWRRPYHGELEVIMRTGRDRSGKPFEYRALFADAPASRGATPAEVAGLVERLQERATVMETLSPDFASACREAASLIQSQAARISALEAGLEPFAGRQALASSGGRK